MADLRTRVPAQSLMELTLRTHPRGFTTPSGEALAWYRGALGEIAVAGVLGQLGPEWLVLHSVPIGDGDSDIDHVAIGPSGVFTINTKSSPGKDLWIRDRALWVAGSRTPYIRNAIFEAERTDRLLSAASGVSVEVTPVIAFVNPGRRTIKEIPDGGVRVVADWELLTLFTGARIFSPDQVQRIVRAALAPETWHSAPRQPLDPRVTTTQFNAIMARALQGAFPEPDAAGTAPAPVPAARARAPYSTPRRASAPARSARTSPPRAPGRRLEFLVRLGLLGGFLVFAVSGGLAALVATVFSAATGAGTP